MSAHGRALVPPPRRTEARTQEAYPASEDPSHELDPGKCSSHFHDRPTGRGRGRTRRASKKADAPSAVTGASPRSPRCRAFSRAPGLSHPAGGGSPNTPLRATPRGHPCRGGPGAPSAGRGTSCSGGLRRGLDPPGRPCQPSHSQSWGPGKPVFEHSSPFLMITFF